MASGRTSYFVDTNILVYAIDPSEMKKRSLASDFLRALIRDEALVLSAQSLNECYRVITERRRVPRAEAREFIEILSESCTGPYSFHVTREAWRIQDVAGYSFWDCMLLGSASLAGCDVFLSEDMQHGQKLNDLTILNPFRPDFADHFSF